MFKDELNKFLEGKLNLENFQETVKENSDEKNFVDSYKTVIEQSKTQTPDFNPFEKIESLKKKRVSLTKRFLPYAALIILAFGLFFIYKIQGTKQNELHLTEFELKELQQNTELALLQFSKELNACMAKFEDAKQMQQPANEIRQLKNFKIKSDNPLKDIKFN